MNSVFKTVLLPDASQRHQALDKNGSFIVQAPAGSGKTTVLIQRFLVILAEVDKPEHVLALTFTRKAVHEMRQRVLRALQEAHESSGPADGHEAGLLTYRLARAVLAHASEKKWSLLDNPTCLRIETWDAFCSTLVRYSHKNRLVLEDASAQYSLAAERVLLNADANADANQNWALDQLFESLGHDPDRLHHCFVEMLSCRDRWLPYVLGTCQDLEHWRRVLETHLKQHIESHLSCLAKACAEAPSIHEVWAHVCDAAKVLEDMAIASPLQACLLPGGPSRFPGTRYLDLPLWQALKTVLMTQQGGWRKQVDKRLGFLSKSESKQAMQAVLNHLSTRTVSSPDPILAAFQALDNLPTPEYTASDWVSIKALMQILPILTLALHQVFEEQGCVDFTHMTEQACASLIDGEGNPTDLALRLDYQIHHILVDEFQDTSLSQFRLLEHVLAGFQIQEGKTLFLVGDPMQSIYRFRSAEVGLFIKVQTQGRVAQLPVQSLQLTAQFRADPDLVTWFNQTFKALFPKRSAGMFPSVVYTAAVPIKPKKITDSNHPSQRLTEPVQAHPVHWHRLDSDEAEASWVVQLMALLRRDYPEDRVAILVRAKHHALPLTRALDRAGMAYQAVGMNSLWDEIWVQDLFSLTCALLDLGDDLSLLACLRTPWLPVSLQGLLNLRSLPGELCWEQWQYLALNQDLNLGFSEQDKEAILNGYTVIQQAQASRYRQPLRTQVMEAWHCLGGPETLPSTQAFLACEAYLSCLEDLECSADVDKIALQRHLQNQNFPEDLGCNTAGLQIMSIHKAKGLEFDHVILPGLEQVVSGDLPNLLQIETYETGEQDHWLMAPIQGRDADNPSQIARYLHHQNKTLAYAEGTRLLYVATTRAKKTLHLGYCLPEKAQIDPRSFLGRLVLVHR